MASNKLLVQKHRAKTLEEGLARVEVTLCRGLITQARDSQSRGGARSGKLCRMP